MNSSNATAFSPALLDEDLIQRRIQDATAKLLENLPEPQYLSSEQRRGIIARYAAVLEGNFIYWMTATLLSVKSAAARSIVLDNLREEVRDCHPDMMRRFAVAAHAMPGKKDALCVHADLTRVRLFLGRLSSVQNLLTMGFFENYIQQFMPYLANLAQNEGSTELEYTDVHGVCDVAHAQELFRALAEEMVFDSSADETNLFEGLDLLAALIQTIIHGPNSQHLS